MGGVFSVSRPIAGDLADGSRNRAGKSERTTVAVLLLAGGARDCWRFSRRSESEGTVCFLFFYRLLLL